MKKTAAVSKSESPAKRIDARIESLGDWRGKTLAKLRALIKEAVPEVVEEWKWRGVPVWYHNGMICTGETYKDVVKVTFAKGAQVKDPKKLFNASLEGNARRAIDFHEGDKVDAAAFKALVRDAAGLNTPKAGKAKSMQAKPTKLAHLPTNNGVTLLSGGNPQIAKADGDAPVQAYIAAMPDWKSDVGRRLDTFIVRTVPKVRKAVRWNSPFYGIEGQGWFLSFHCFAKYIKVTFLRGTALRPLPPVESKDPNTRYYHIHADGQIDEALMRSWLKQAAAMPGDPLF